MKLQVIINVTVIEVAVVEIAATCINLFGSIAATCINLFGLRVIRSK